MSTDTETFCPRCRAGVDSGEHHEKCVRSGHAEDGEAAHTGASHDELLREDGLRRVSERAATARTYGGTGINAWANRYASDVPWLHAEVTRQDNVIKSVLSLHQPESRTEYNVPVFDEFDSPTRVVNGCSCGSSYYPCPTVQVIERSQS